MPQYRVRRGVEAVPQYDDDGLRGYTIRLADGRVRSLAADLFDALFEPDGEGPGSDHPGPAPLPAW